MATKTISEQDFMALPDGEFLMELVDGEVRLSPRPTLSHSKVTMRLLLRLGTFVESQGLGLVLPPDTGFRMPGGNVRAPDVTFVRKEKVTEETSPPRYLDPPDLAVEVLSPHDHDHPREFMDKIGEYLASGVRLIWVIDIRKRRALVYRSLSQVREVSIDGALDGEDVVPGFSCPLAAVLD